jgi:hypothetical protein
MVGEQLNDSPVTWGGTYKDEIANGGTYNGYTTSGVSSNFTINTLIRARRLLGPQPAAKPE